MMFKLRGWKIFALVFLFLIVIVNLSSAQPTLTKKNFFQLNHDYTIMRPSTTLPYSNLMNTGANHTWDLTGVLFNLNDTINGVDPSATPFYNDPNVNYDTANISLLIQNNYMTYFDNMYKYFSVNDSAVNYIGEWAYNGNWESWYYHHTDLREVLRFPFTYNSTFTDYYKYSSYDMSGSGVHKGYGYTTVLADGYGTLIIAPGDTIRNILRVKEIITTRDSSVQGIFDYTSTGYAWYSSNYEGQLLSIEANNSFVLKTRIPSSIYESKHRNSKRVFVYPNPASDYLLADFLVQENTKAELLNILGARMHCEFERTNNGIKINLEKIPNGTCFLKINEVMIEKIIVQH